MTKIWRLALAGAASGKRVALVIGNSHCRKAMTDCVSGPPIASITALWA